MMTKPAALAAAFSDFKLVKTRKVCQLIFEVSVEEANQALNILGGLPNSGEERWFAIAALKTEPKQKVEPNRFVQRAGILCTDELFQSFLRTEWPMNWVQQEGPEEDRAAAVLRQLCEVKSRKELATNLEAQACFDNLLGRFEGWKRGIE